MGSSSVNGIPVQAEPIDPIAALPPRPTRLDDPEGWSIKDPRGCNLLHQAAESEDWVTNEAKATATITMLLNYQGVVDHIMEKDNYGMTPLHRAAEGWYCTPAVKLLLKYDRCRAGVNDVDEYGLTPLHRAARGKMAGSVEALLGVAGIHVNAKDKQQRTPLQLALQKDMELGSQNHWTDVIIRLCADPRVRVYTPKEYEYLSGLNIVLKKKQLKGTATWPEQWKESRVQQAAEAILVAAALFATLGFSGFLNPPKGWDEQGLARASGSAAMALFFYCSGFSFLFSVATMLGATSLMLPVPKDDVGAMPYTLAWVSIGLALCVVCGLIAFVSAACAILQASTPTVAVPTAIGGFVFIGSLVLFGFVAVKTFKTIYT